MSHRKVQNIEVGVYEGKVGMSLTHEGETEKQHILFSPEVALTIGREMISIATALKNQGFRDSIGVKEKVKMEIH